MLIRRAEVGAHREIDVRLAAGRISEIAPRLEPHADESVIDAAGGTLLPGLHDHHLHLLALAASERSVRCGPPEVHDESALAKALAGASTHAGWVRGVGYHESVAGPLDRAILDRLIPDRPARLQHRSGALWIVNSAGARRLGLDDWAACEDGRDEGVERDTAGRATGRIYRADAWLRTRLAPSDPPVLDGIGARLARYGVTGLTDATPANGPDELRVFETALGSGALPQRLVIMGGAALPRPTHPRATRSAVKIVLDERALPRFDAFRDAIAGAHAADRPVAIHCVTRTELVLAVAALEAAGIHVGDRLEHASIAPPALVTELAGLGITVVTQPHFLYERGDAYARDVDDADRPWLYRCRGFLEAGVPLGGGTDAPFGSPDPWRAMRSAVDRRSASGLEFEASEALTPEEALALFTSAPRAPGGPARPLCPGAVADLCLLDRPWARARDLLASDCVAATFLDGETLWNARV